MLNIYSMFLVLCRVSCPLWSSFNNNYYWRSLRMQHFPLCFRVWTVSLHPRPSINQHRSSTAPDLLEALYRSQSVIIINKARGWLCIIEMSAIQASILSTTNNERRVARSTTSSRSASTASASVSEHHSQGRRGVAEMMPEVAATSLSGAGGYSTQMRRNSIDSSLSKVIIIFSAIPWYPLCFCFRLLLAIII